MASYTCTIQDLQTLSATSLQLTYNTDAADTLSLMLRPENYAELPLQALDRLTVTDGERIVFSGLVPMGANCAAQAAAGETVDITLQSDYYVLDHTVYAKVDPFGRPMFARKVVEGSTTTVAKVVQGIETWLGGYLPSKLTCEASAVVPTPTANGTAPCASVLNDCLRWVPDVVTVQRYGEQNTLTVTTPEKLGEPLVVSPSTHPLQSVSIRPRHDLVVPVCALVGAVHAVWPDGGDVREPGAFVYAVPFDPKDEQQSGGAGSSPASQKMIVKGVPLPENKIFEASPEEWKGEDITADSNAAKFIKAFLPEYAPFIGCVKLGACLVNIVGEDALAEDLETDTDEEAKLPANYVGDVKQWQTWSQSIYVHTEGSFAASSNKKKNVKGLNWCKATLALVLAIRKSPNSDIPTYLQSAAGELFPGRTKGTFEGKSARFAYVRKTFNVNLINRRRKIYDPATNKLCSGDEQYTQDPETEENETPTMADYKAAMKRYYDVASKLQHEGSISMLYDGQINPAELTGRRVLVQGMRPEWESMSAIVRSVSWNYEQQKFTLSLGTRSMMGFDEYLERRLIARNRGRDKAQEEALAYDSLDEAAQEEQESEMSVSPNISSKTDTTTTGRWVKPFTLYTNPETKKLTLKGGTFTRKGQSYTVEDTETQIYHGTPNDKPWEEGSKVKLKMLKHKKTGVRTFNIYQ